MHSHSVNLCCNISGPITVVDVYDSNSVRTGINHRKQRRKTIHAGPVAHRGRNCDDRLIHQAAEHACQRSFHTGNGYNTVGTLNRIEA